MRKPYYLFPEDFPDIVGRSYESAQIYWGRAEGCSTSLPGKTMGTRLKDAFTKIFFPTREKATEIVFLVVGLFSGTSGVLRSKRKCKTN